jgi:predicted molibdopterin-dependent oxidoreductase YjgC
VNGNCSRRLQSSRGESGTFINSERLYPDKIYVEMNSQDAESLGIGTNQKALIASRRGEIIAAVFVTNTVQPGQLFIPMQRQYLKSCRSLLCDDCRKSCGIDSWCWQNV